MTSRRVHCGPNGWTTVMIGSALAGVILAVVTADAILSGLGRALPELLGSVATTATGALAALALGGLPAAGYYQSKASQGRPAKRRRPGGTSRPAARTKR